MIDLTCAVKHICLDDDAYTTKAMTNLCFAYGMTDEELNELVLIQYTMNHDCHEEYFRCKEIVRQAKYGTGTYALDPHRAY